MLKESVVFMDIEVKYKLIKFKNKSEKDKYFLTFYDKFAKYVYCKVRNRINNHEDAKDLVSDIFLVIYQKFDEIETEELLFNYMLTTIDRMTKRKANKLERYIPSSNDYFENLFIYDLDNTKILLDKLGSLERSIVIYKIFYGYTFRDIGKILNMSLGNVHRIYNIAIDKLHEAVLGKEDKIYVK